MSPTISYGRGGRCYRYYVSAPLQKGVAAGKDDSLRRIPGATVDAFVLDAVARLARRGVESGALRSVLRRIEIHPSYVLLTMDRAGVTGQVRDIETDLSMIGRRLDAGERVAPVDADPSLLAVTIPVRVKTRGGRSWMSMPDGKAPGARAKSDPTLVWGLSRSHGVLSAMGLRPDGRYAVGQADRIKATSFDRAMAGLAFLAPDIQAAIVAGRQPAGLKLDHILRSEIPLAWVDQRAKFGF
jgi:hypothetical protein